MLLILDDNPKRRGVMLKADPAALPDGFSTEVQLVSLGNEHPNTAACPASPAPGD